MLMTLIFWEKTDTTQKNTEALLDASKEVGLEVNSEKTKYMLMSRCQKAGQRQSIKIANRSFESVAKFTYLGTTLTNQNCIQEEIKSRLNSGNAFTIKNPCSLHQLLTNVLYQQHFTLLRPSLKSHTISADIGLRTTRRSSSQL
jgi:hypothetical protein